MPTSHAKWIVALLGVLWGILPMSANDVSADEPVVIPESVSVYVGTYTGGQSKGIYHFRLDLKSGQLTADGVTEGVENPSYLAVHPSGRFVFAVNEISNFSGNRSGAVSAFGVDGKTGALTLLNQQPSGGAGPCHLIVDDAGKHVLAANYGGGSLCVLPIGEDGRLGEATAFVQHEGSSVNPRRQSSPHAHSINLDSRNAFAVAADLGLDKLLVYRYDAERGTLEPNKPPSASVAAGAGPRHFAFHPLNVTAYTINELNSTVTAFRYDARFGRMKELQTLSTLPEGYEGNNSTADVQVHYTGNFVYGSNRGHDSIAVFSVNPRTGELTARGHYSTGGKTPRGFGIDPTGNFLLAANQNSNNIVVFRIDFETGALKRLHEVSVPTPVCVKFLPVRID